MVSWMDILKIAGAGLMIFGTPWLGILLFGIILKKCFGFKF